MRGRLNVRMRGRLRLYPRSLIFKMEDDMPPFLCRLIVVLGKPNSLEIALRMLRNWKNNCIPYEHKAVSCTCSVLSRRREDTQRTVCQGFHWNCVLEYLIAKTTALHDNEIIL